MEYTQENENEQKLVVKEVKDGFIFGGHYEVSVSAESFGIICSKSGVFGEFNINIMQIMYYYAIIDSLFSNDIIYRCSI